jgi:hypothetical protein
MSPWIEPLMNLRTSGMRRGFFLALFISGFVGRGTGRARIVDDGRFRIGPGKKSRSLEERSRILFDLLIFVLDCEKGKAETPLEMR